MQHPPQITKITEDMLAARPAEFERLCSLLPVQWGGSDVLLRLGVLYDRTPVGLVAVCRRTPSAALEDLLASTGVDPTTFAECSDLVVLREFRGRGVASGLLTGIASWSAAFATPLYARLRNGSEASRVFAEAGWRELGVVGEDRIMVTDGCRDLVVR